MLKVVMASLALAGLVLVVRSFFRIPRGWEQVTSSQFRHESGSVQLELKPETGSWVISFDTGLGFQPVAAVRGSRRAALWNAEERRVERLKRQGRAA